MSDTDDEFVLPAIFDDTISFAVDSTQVLFQGDGWSVHQRTFPPENGSARVARWLTHSAASSLDQTRVEFEVKAGEGASGDDACPAAFERGRLNAVYLQAMALVAALAIEPMRQRGDQHRPVIVMLGAGGMALPLALLAADSSMEVVAVEIDLVAIRLAAEYFAAYHGACSGRLSVLQADALELVTSRRLHSLGPLASHGAAMVAVDIDFLRGGQPPAAFLSEEFWTGVGDALRPGGVVVVNTIGGTATDVDNLARIAVDHVARGRVDVAAGTLEPGAHSTRTSWTAFVPRPSVLILGPSCLLDAFSSPDLASRLASGDVAACSWGAVLGSGVLRDLASGGSYGQWRSISAGSSS